MTTNGRVLGTEGYAAPEVLSGRLSIDAQISCRLIVRCLQKDPKDRYATFNDVRDELRIVAASSATSPASLVV